MSTAPTDDDDNMVMMRTAAAAVAGALIAGIVGPADYPPALLYGVGAGLGLVAAQQFATTARPKTVFQTVRTVLPESEKLATAKEEFRANAKMRRVMSALAQDMSLTESDRAKHQAEYNRLVAEAERLKIEIAVLKE